MGGKWPHSWCFVLWRFQNLFKATHRILVMFSFSFYSKRLVKMQVLHGSSFEECRIFLSENSDFYMIGNQFITVQAFIIRIVRLLSGNEIFLRRYMNWSINIWSLPFNKEIVPSWVKHVKSVLSEFALIPTPLVAYGALQ